MSVEKNRGNGMHVTVIGAGLAGSEAAWQLAQRGIDVTLCEMKPEKRTPAHVTNDFAELCCSNSLRSDQLENAVGLLKEELRRMDSLILSCADATRVEAGGALAVDRHGFARMVTEKIRSHPHIAVAEGEITALPAEGEVIVASGPLTSDALAEQLQTLLGENAALHFYDAAAPLVSAESVDMNLAWMGSRYDKGTADYVNCPMNEAEYDAFWKELTEAQQAEVHGFEDSQVFEGCMPVEVMARRGHDTLCYGPLKPRGLRDPRTGVQPYAVVQLRRDNQDGSVYNLVGFQTHLKFPEQRRVFSMIPALHDADFLRYGVMHRNTFLDSPRLLNRYYQLKSNPRISFAGQMTGVEGYVESAASGFLTGVETARRLLGQPPVDFPQETAVGALALYISNQSVTVFQPMNVNFGIIPPLDHRVKGKRNKNAELSQRSLALIDQIKPKVCEA
jgi:methylenetetrahydrofolate--tRNA-(uracil-5-)-methyltransferase